MKAKILVVAVVGLMVGCGGGGSFESAKGVPLVQEELPAYGVNGPSTVYFQDAYSEETAKGEPAIQEQRVYAEAESKGGSTTRFQDTYAEETNKGESAVNDVEDLVYCTRWPFADALEYGCRYALSAINSGMSEAKNDFDADPQAFQIQAKGMVDSVENYLKRSKDREASFYNVVENLRDAKSGFGNYFETYWQSTGYAIATYYYVRGIPEGHTNNWNPGRCVDELRCGDEYLKYQWN